MLPEELTNDLDEEVAFSSSECWQNYPFTYSKCLQLCSTYLPATCLDDQLCYCNNFYLNSYKTHNRKATLYKITKQQVRKYFLRWDIWHECTRKLWNVYIIILYLFDLNRHLMRTRANLSRTLTLNSVHLPVPYAISAISAKIFAKLTPIFLLHFQQGGQLGHCAKFPWNSILMLRFNKLNPAFAQFNLQIKKYI